MQNLKSYYNEADALQNKRIGEHLFGYDAYRKDGTIGKRFITCSYEKIIDIMDEDHNLYEYYGYDASPTKLFFDIDYKVGKNYNVKYETHMELFVDIKNHLINRLNTFFNKDVAVNAVILYACREDKFSFHIIYPSIIFKNMKQMKKFVKDVIYDDKYENIIDLAPYKKSNLRMMGQSKLGNPSSILQQTDKEIYYADTLLQYITEEDDIDFVNNVDEEENNIDVKFKPSKIDASYELVEDLLMILDVKRATQYEEWLKVFFILKSLGEDYLCLFLKFSARSKDYNEQGCIQKWNQTINETVMTMDTLICWARKDDYDNYMKINIKHNLGYHELSDEKFEMVEIGNYKDIKGKPLNTIFNYNFSSRYLLPSGYRGAEEQAKIIRYWNNTADIKCLLIKSPYGTGKTMLLKDLTDKYDRCLIMSYRQTLSYNLKGNLNGFQLYKEDDNANKLICQVDSLFRTALNYDLVIIDEIESMLRHFSARTFEKNSYSMFKRLIRIIGNCKKLICLDGDVSNRSFSFLNSVLNGQFIFLNNNVETVKKYFKMIRDYDRFINQIKKWLKDGKNVYIATMEANEGLTINDMFKDEYKTMCYYGKTDDKIKMNLCNVNEIWGNYQLVISSPTVEAGVDFNIEHFDYVCGMISHLSTSQYGFMQMMSRVRKVRNPYTLVYMGILPYSVELFGTYGYGYVKRFYNQFITEKNVEGYEVGDCEIYDNLMVYNRVESSNKTFNLFIPVLINIMLNKGHTVENIDGVRIKTRCKIDNIVKDKVLNIEIGDNDEYKTLMNKQTNNQLTEEDKFKLLKHIHVRTFGTDDIEFLTNHYMKLSSIRKYRLLTGRLDIQNCETTEAEYKIKVMIHETEKKLLSFINFNEIEAGATITIDETKMNEIYENSKIEMSSDYLFITSKGEKNKNKTVNKYDTFLKFTNMLRVMCSEYGIEMVKDNKRKKINGVDERFSIFNFSINNIINDRIKYFDNLAHEAELLKLIDYFLDD